MTKAKISSELKSKLDKLNKTVKKLEGDFGKGCLVNDNTLGVDMDIKKLSSRSVNLDYALGGGYPFGRVIEMYGQPSAGKSTLCLEAIAEVQSKGGTVAYIDAENALDLDYCRALGVKTDQWFISQPESAEVGYDILLELAQSGDVDMIVVDSTNALVPRAELESESGTSVMGIRARLLSQCLMKLAGAIKRTNTLVVFISQMRLKIGVSFGDPRVIGVGEALKFYASQRLEISRSHNKKGEEIVSNRVKVKVTKNKVAPPYRVAEFDIGFGIGIDKNSEVIDFAVDYGIIEKSGSWYSYNGERLGQGKANVKILLEDRKELFDEIRLKAMEEVNKSKEEKQSSNDEEVIVEEKENVEEANVRKQKK